MNATLEQKPVIGRSVMVRDEKSEQHELVGATVIDALAGENRAKRIRLQTGPFAGEVRMFGEYLIMEFL